MPKRYPTVIDLYALRIAHGWSQQELARRVGVSCNTIGCLERGQQGTSSGTLARLARVLRVSQARLTGDAHA
jgi:transcriptional regulator with XRE-family HTH domain